MSRLIDADKLIEAIEKSRKENPHTDNKVASNHNYEHLHFIKLVNEQPTAFDKKIYNKAIDDFAEKICTYGTYDDYGNAMDILVIAEKLKAGGRDE